MQDVDVTMLISGYTRVRLIGKTTGWHFEQQCCVTVRHARSCSPAPSAASQGKALNTEFVLGYVKTVVDLFLGQYTQH